MVSGGNLMATTTPAGPGAPDCAREGCGHAPAGHQETRRKNRVPVRKCALCECRDYLQPNGKGPRRTAPNADATYPAEVLTTDEVAALISGCSAKAPTGIRNRALLWLLYRSGLRVSEVLALRVPDVSMSAHTVRVLHGKGNKATTRGFHPSADDALARWIDTRRTRGIRNGTLFCTLAGAPLSATYIRDLLKRQAAKAGIEKRVHPHGLRHTFANELRAKGVDVVIISKLLGHSSIAVTVRYLDHLTNHQAVEALTAVDLPGLDL
jgi:site-specific recombinase XerD